MAWSTPRVWTTAELITASNLNTFISDELAYLKANLFEPANFDYGLLIARCTGDVTVTTSELDVTGCSVSLNRNGTWWIMGVEHIDLASVPAAAEITGRLKVNNVVQTDNIYLNAGSGAAGTLMQVWTYALAAQPQTAKLTVFGASLGGTVLVKATDSVIAAVCAAVP